MAYDFHGLFNQMQAVESQVLSDTLNFCGDYTQEQLNDDEDEEKQFTDSRNTKRVTRHETSNLDHHLNESKFS